MRSSNQTVVDRGSGCLTFGNFSPRNLEMPEMLRLIQKTAVEATVGNYLRFTVAFADDDALFRMTAKLIEVEPL